MSKLDIGKRSTSDSEKERECIKKIKILEVKDLKKKNIEITSIKDIGPADMSSMSSFLSGKGEKDKISLKRVRKS